MTIVDRSPLAVTDREGWGGQYGDALTPRECELLGLLAAGYTPQEVARQMGIGHNTFWNDLRDAKARMGADTTVRAVVLFAIQQAGSGEAHAGVAPDLPAPPDPIRRSA